MIAAIVIVALAIIIFLCTKLCSKLIPSSDETENTDVIVLKRLDTVKDVNDPKYAARTRAEALDIIAKNMAIGASLSDESIDLSVEEDS